MQIARTLVFTTGISYDCIRDYRWPRISDAARSAIMMMGELGLPEVICGITEPSTTRKPSIPLTRNSESTTDMGSVDRPILQVPTG